MDNNQWINDQGLFLGQDDFNFVLPDSFETIANYLKTIKEYRAYAHPDAPEWQEYIREFFHILGFSTAQKAPRLIALSDIGADSAPKALALLLAPGDNFEDIVPGLDWLSYLHYAAHYHQAPWGFLTNGLELKVFDFRQTDYQAKFLWADLDGIVREDKLDSFFTLYKVFCAMRGHPQGAPPPQRRKKADKAIAPALPRGSEYTKAYHTDGRSPQAIMLYEALRAKIMGLSDTVTERFNKVNISYLGPRYFCSLYLQKNQLKIWIALPADQVLNPAVKTRDVSKIGHHGSGDTEIVLQQPSQVDAVFDVIRQAYEKGQKQGEA